VNHFGASAQRFWQNHQPARYAQLTDPETFFTDLGMQVASLSTELASLLAQKEPPRQDYLHEVARLQGARRVAEEIAMRQLVWEGDTDLTLTQAREEGASIIPEWENLIRWAERISDNEETVAWVDILDKAQYWAVPVSFIEEMLEADDPRATFRANEPLIREAEAIRFLRELH
jgi:hypothetical protein